MVEWGRICAVGAHLRRDCFVHATLLSQKPVHFVKVNQLTLLVSSDGLGRADVSKVQQKQISGLQVIGLTSEVNGYPRALNPGIKGFGRFLIKTLAAQ